MQQLDKSHPDSSSQTQTCKQVSPLPASLMSYEPVDTVNKPCEAKWSLYLPLGLHSKCRHICGLSRNKISVPIMAQVLSFSQAQQINLGGQLGTTMFEFTQHTWMEALILTSIHVIAQPVEQTSLSLLQVFLCWLIWIRSFVDQTTVVTCSV